MTLAVFEDSGWYTVDYSQAEDFLWGKGSNLVSVLHAVTNRYEILPVTCMFVAKVAVVSQNTKVHLVNPFFF